MVFGLARLGSGLWQSVLILLTMALAAGCGRSRLDTVPLSGKVTYQGSPIPWGSVSFQPTDPKAGRPAMADINVDGSYEVATLEHDAGLMAGEYKVSVYAAKTPLFVPNAEQKAAAARVKLPTPERYANPDTSGLTLTVAPGDGPKTFDIDLGVTGVPLHAKGL